MIYLYYGGGASISEFRGPLVADEEWQRERATTVRLLRARRHKVAAALLEQAPFEWLDATNDFNDEFSVLQAVVPVEQYVRLQEAKEDRSIEPPYKTIAETLSEIWPQRPVVRFIVATLETDTGQAPRVPPPSPRVTSESIDSALADAELLARTRGPASAVDRVHTAVHGYLRVALERNGHPAAPLASVTELFRQLRDRDERLRAAVEGGEQSRRIVMSLASILDAANTLRNTASGAHPTSGRLQRAEAMLVINSARSLMHYLDEKLDE